MGDDDDIERTASVKGGEDGSHGALCRWGRKGVPTHTQEKKEKNKERHQRKLFFFFSRRVSEGGFGKTLRFVVVGVFFFCFKRQDGRRECDSDVEGERERERGRERESPDAV